MIMGDLISIIIPVYNAEKYLYKCLESVCGQTYQQLEIILVDDGSTDSSGHICDEWAEKDERIRVIHKQNGGVSAARNDGLKASTGAYIGFVDSDDWIDPRMYEKLITAIANTDMACCGYVDYPLGTLETPALKGIKHGGICNPLEAALHIYERDGYFTSIWNKLYRREVLVNNGSFIQMDPSLSWGEDEVWLAQVLKNCRKVAFVPESLYYWRPTQESATRNIRITDRQMTLFEAKKRAMEILPQDEKLQELVKTRMFNDCFSMKVIAYATRDLQKYKTISKTLSRIKSAWMKSYDVALIRKVKVELMEIGMKMCLPGRWIQKIDNVTRYGVKKS